MSYYIKNSLIQNIFYFHFKFLKESQILIVNFKHGSNSQHFSKKKYVIYIIHGTLWSSCCLRNAFDSWQTAWPVSRFHSAQESRNTWTSPYRIVDVLVQQLLNSKAFKALWISLPSPFWHFPSRHVTWMFSPCAKQKTQHLKCIIMK